MTVHITSLTPATFIEVSVPGKDRRWPYIYVDFDSASTFYLLEFGNVPTVFHFCIFCFFVLFCYLFFVFVFVFIISKYIVFTIKIQILISNRYIYISSR